MINSRELSFIRGFKNWKTLRAHRPTSRMEALTTTCCEPSKGCKFPLTEGYFTGFEEELAEYHADSPFATKPFIFSIASFARHSASSLK